MTDRVDHHVETIAREAISKLIARHCYTPGEAVDELRRALSDKQRFYGQHKQQPWKPGDPKPEVSHD